MFLQTSYAAVVLATLITTVAQPNCQYPWIALQVFQFFQASRLPTEPRCLLPGVCAAAAP